MCWQKGFQRLGRKTETSPKVASKLVALQGRTMFLNRMRDKDGFKTCQMCNMRKTCIDHLATKCTKMLDRYYKRRRDNITKMVHFGLCAQFGFMDRRSSLLSHMPESVVENQFAKIWFETQFTESKKHTNRPDLICYDRQKGLIILTEVGVSSPNFVKRREIQKKLKYSRWARSIWDETGVKTTLLPLVCSWDGLVTYNFRENLVELGF